jgi:hypothetical protein
MAGVSTILFVLLILFAALNGLNSLPVLIFMFRPETMRLTFDEPSEGLARIAGSPQLQEWVEKFQTLGFALIGVKNETLFLTRRKYREAALVSPERDAYASIVLHRDGSPAGVYFFTPFRDGGMVFTRKTGLAPEAEGPNLSVQNCASADFGEMYARHAERVRAFQATGAIPSVSSSPESRMEATRMFYSSDYSRHNWRYLIHPNILMFLFSLLILAVWWFLFGNKIEYSLSATGFRLFL